MERLKPSLLDARQALIHQKVLLGQHNKRRFPLLLVLTQHLQKNTVPVKRWQKQWQFWGGEALSFAGWLNAPCKLPFPLAVRARPSTWIDVEVLALEP